MLSILHFLSLYLGPYEDPFLMYAVISSWESNKHNVNRIPDDKKKNHKYMWKFQPVFIGGHMDVNIFDSTNHMILDEWTTKSVRIC